MSSSQLTLPLEHRAAMTRGDFILAPGNAKAFSFLEAWPDWAAPAAALVGPSASGKTHLAHIWAARSGAPLIAARDLKEVIAGPVAIENAETGFGDESALFAMLEAGGPLLLTAREAPAHWPAALPDLSSRFRALVAFELGAPDEALLLALAVKLFADRQLTVPESVVTHLVRQLERSPAAIRDFIARADKAALAAQKPINLQLIRALMAGPAALS
jgi:chromosomal replication initiation ATPase DnaA